MPTCWIIAGPNGAGKTTFALEYLPTVAHCLRFIAAKAGEPDVVSAPESAAPGSPP